MRISQSHDPAESNGSSVKSGVAWVVLKLGGVSVSTLANWRHIRDRIAQCQADGARPLVVCSAVAGVTDLLVALGRSAAQSARRRTTLEQFCAVHEALGSELGIDVGNRVEQARAELENLLDQIDRSGLKPALNARILAQGELLSTWIGADCLRSHGLSVSRLDARTLLDALPADGVSESQAYLCAHCAHAPDSAFQNRLENLPEAVLLTQGFIAANAAGETVLLGRGGSDTSAACLAGKLQAARLEIWTHVPGLFTIDPCKASTARLIRRLGYREAQAMASMGAKVLHPDSLAPAQAGGIPIVISSVAQPHLPYTEITRTGHESHHRIKAVTGCSNLFLFSAFSTDEGLRGPVFWEKAFHVFRRRGLHVEALHTTPCEIRLVVNPGITPMPRGEPARINAELSAFAATTASTRASAICLIGSETRHFELIGAALAREPEGSFQLYSGPHGVSVVFPVDPLRTDRIAPMLHQAFVDDLAKEGGLGPTWEQLKHWPKRRAPADRLQTRERVSI